MKRTSAKRTDAAAAGRDGTYDGGALKRRTPPRVRRARRSKRNVPLEPPSAEGLSDGGEARASPAARAKMRVKKIGIWV